MRRRLAYLFLILSASPATAQALTTAQLQQIATQDAINAGIPPNVFLAQIQAESGFNPNIGCNAAGACGIAQFIPATATQFGINPNDPVASLQAAAQYDAQLEAQTGSLIGALTAYSGGCTPASPCNAGYAQAFQLAAADANGDGDGVDFAGGDGVAFGDGSALLVANPAAPPAAAASPSALPFEWVYNQVINGIMGQVDTSIQTVESITSGPATAVLALAIAIMGMMTMFGNMDMAVFLSFAIRAAIVMAFVQMGNTFYSDWIEQFVLGLPTYLERILFDRQRRIAGSALRRHHERLDGKRAQRLALVTVELPRHLHRVCARAYDPDHRAAVACCYVHGVPDQHLPVAGHADDRAADDPRPALPDNP